MECDYLNKLIHLQRHGITADEVDKSVVAVGSFSDKVHIDGFRDVSMTDTGSSLGLVQLAPPSHENAKGKNYRRPKSPPVENVAG